MRGESLRKYLTLPVGSTPMHFSDCDVASRLESQMSTLENAGLPTRQMREDFDGALADVLRELRRGRMILDYRPPEKNVVTIPPRDDPMHLQALLYWTTYLRKPFQRVLEAARRCGEGASARQVLATIQQIEFENRMCQTDRFFDPRVH